MKKAKLVEGGIPPEGFQPIPVEFAHGRDHFSPHVGDFYYKKTEDSHAFLVQVQQHHCNWINVAHGAFMAALADIVCGGSTYEHFKDGPLPSFVTVSLAHEFLASAPLGQWILAYGKIRQSGRSIVFVDCEMFIKDKLIGLSRCVMKVSGRRGN